MSKNGPVFEFLIGVESVEKEVLLVILPYFRWPILIQADFFEWEV